MSNEKVTKRADGRLRIQIMCNPKDSQVQQNARDANDINIILAKYTKNGQYPEIIKENPMYGDFSEVVDYRTAQEVISKANMQFAALDSATRQRFENDPAKFYAFVKDPKNKEELYKLGLAERPKAPPVLAAPAGPAGSPPAAPAAEPPQGGK